MPPFGLGAGNLDIDESATLMADELARHCRVGRLTHARHARRRDGGRGARAGGRARAERRMSAIAKPARMAGRRACSRCGSAGSRCSPPRAVPPAHGEARGGGTARHAGRDVLRRAAAGPADRLRVVDDRHDRRRRSRCTTTSWPTCRSAASCIARRRAREVQLSRALRVSEFKIADRRRPRADRRAGTVLGDTLLVLARAGARKAQPDTQRVELDGPGAAAHARSARRRARRAPEGRHAAYTLPVFDPDRDGAEGRARVASQAESVFVVQDSSVFDAARARWHGARPTRCAPGAWRPSRRAARPASRGWVDEQGRIVAGDAAARLRRSSGGRTRWRSRTGRPTRGSAAAPVTADRDIYETTAIAASKRCASDLDAAARAADAASTSTASTSKGYRQRLRGDTLTITREAPAALDGRVRAARTARTAR